MNKINGKTIKFAVQLPLFILAISFSPAQAIESVLPILANLSPAEQLFKIATQQFRSSEFSTALSNYQQALNLFETEKNRQRQGEALLNIGITHRILGNYEGAEKAVQQALDIAKALKQTQLEAASLNELGVIYYSRSQYREAIAFYQQALTLSESLQLQELQARILDNLGVVYRRQGSVRQALEFHQKALTLVETLNQPSLQGLILNNIAIVNERLGNYQQALELNQKALSLVQKQGDRYLEGRVLHSLGVIYSYFGEYTQAKKYSQESILIREEIGDQFGLSQTLNNLGGIYNSLGDYEQAFKIYNQALEINQRISNKIEEGITRSNLGLLYWNRGQYQPAIESYEKALKLSQEIGDRPGEAYIFISLGGVYTSQSQYAKALEYYQKALKINQEIGDKAGEGSTLNNIGGVYYSLGQYEPALTYYQNSLSLREKISDRAGIGTTLNNIGLIYEVQKQYDQAIQFYQDSLKIREEIGDQAGIAVSLNNLAFNYYLKQQFEQALAFYEKSLSIQQKIGDRIGEATSFNNLGLVYQKLNQRTLALASYQQALEIFTENGHPEGTRSSLSNLGTILEQDNQIQLAIIFYKKAVNISEEIRFNLKGLPQNQQQSYIQTIAETYRRLADLLLQQNRVLEAQQVLDLLKVQELEDYLKNLRGNENTAVGIELLPQEQQIDQDYLTQQNQLIQLGKELLQLREIPPQQRSPQQQEQIAKIEQLQQQARQSFNAFVRSPEVVERVKELSTTAGGQNLDLPNLNRLQGQLRQIQPNAAILYPLILQDRIELVLVTPYAPPLHRSVTIHREELNRKIAQFRSALTNPNPRNLEEVQSLASEFYNLLIKPLEKDLTDAEIQTLIYAPDGALRYIPLAILYDQKQWLVERFTINTITAASLTNLTPPPTQEMRVLAGALTQGSYEFQLGTRQFSFSGLPYAKIEVDNIANQIPDTEKFIDQQFNPDLIIPQLNDYTIVHLATHAAFVPGQPEDSFILFGDGRVVTLRDIETWSLPNVALVILSACQTAVGGTLGNGEEILGLGYQMQQAGALATLASLWRVDDQGTQLLMNEFYKALNQGKHQSAAALRQAQIHLIKSQTSSNGSDHSQWSHPYYWAGFIIIGNGL